MSSATDSKDHVYKLVELVGSSEKSIEDAIQKAIARASKRIAILQTRCRQNHTRQSRSVGLQHFPTCPSTSVRENP